MQKNEYIQKDGCVGAAERRRGKLIQKNERCEDKMTQGDEQRCGDKMTQGDKLAHEDKRVREGKKPDFIFEASWEVCNKVGGIYAVLSTRAKQMMKYADGRVMFVGPDIWRDEESPYFEPTNDVPEFATYMRNNMGLTVRVGRWRVPGRPIVVLVDFTPVYERKNEIYGTMWERFGVDSLHGYGDYDEASMFGYAAGMVMAGYIHYKDMEGQRVVAHFNEWMTAFGLFYMKMYEPGVATLFTTHATTVGRSIAGNGKALYDYMRGYNGDQMARELNVESKHSVEKCAAREADCFTTVSDITDDECAQLLEKRADVVTPNGFELDFVPKGQKLPAAAAAARERLIEVAERVTGQRMAEDVTICAISGRYEYKNKGIDLFVNILNRLNHNHDGHQLLAYILVPAWQDGVQYFDAEGQHYTTHHLVERWNDPVSQALSFYGLDNDRQDRVKVVFVPAYLHGNDGVLNMTYYDLLAGFDFTVFPSYYEPWGYTPMESVAFGVPTITTTLSGFGRWVNAAGQGLGAGVGVIPRTDSNFDYVSSRITEEMEMYIRAVATASKDRRAAAVVNKARRAAKGYASAAQWKHFFEYYVRAYEYSE